MYVIITDPSRSLDLSHVSCEFQMITFALDEPRQDCGPEKGFSTVKLNIGNVDDNPPFA